VPLHQLRQALADPMRLRRLHYSAVLAGLRALAEPDEHAFLAARLGLDAAGVAGVEQDLLDDRDFAASLETAHRRVRGAPIRLLGPSAAEDHDRGHRLLYCCVRILRPAIVVETGVFDGLSSAIVLKALRDNGAGRLCSIDVPARSPIRASTDKMRFDRLPAAADPGWIVPAALRERWTLRLGESRELLAPWLAELGPIDLFVHDSLHTRENMLREYRTAWPSLAAGGLLVSDDVFWNGAFRQFAREVRVSPHVLRGIGFLRKAA
jgi:predicted O-methyltransferase YrrM